jgi:transposase
MAMPTRQDLPNDPEALKDRVLYLEAKLEKYEAELRLARSQRFAASSERNENQYRMFDEAEQEAETAEVETETVTVKAHEKRRPKRKPLPDDVPRQIIEHPPERTHCGCGSALERIGTKTSEQLDIIPQQVFVIEHRRGTYKCPRCDDAEPETAPLPAQPIPKSIASPGLLAHVATSKYADGLPLYRQSAMFARLGIDLPRQTMASHMVAAGELVAPLVARMGTHVRGYDIVQMDETRVQVLKEPNRPAKAQSWMWVMRGGPPRQRLILFHYEQSRSSSVPKTLLQDYAGYLQSDGYGGYGAVTTSPKIVGLGCWAHARRGFHKAQQAMPKGKAGRPHEALSYIGRLYQLERQWKDLAPEQRTQRRQAEARPILDAFGAWLAKQDLNPESLLGRAIAYTRNEWSRLEVYLEDGRLEMDNNAVENAIRPFAVGRKAWLFSNTPRGADASARLYSVVETAKANGLNAYAYLKLIFTALPAVHTDDELDALMPWAIPLSDLEAMLVTPTLTDSSQ